MPMVIKPYDSTMAEDLTSVYNDTIRDVPHCYPVGADELASALAASVGPHDAVQERMHSESVLVAMENDAVLGFAHVAVGRGEFGKDPERGVIRFLTYRRGHRSAGQALLDAGEDYLRQRGMSRVEAFLPEYGYPFYQLHWSRASDRWDHIRGLLGWNGYAVHSGEVFMDWRDFEPPSAGDVPSDTDVTLDWETGRGTMPNLTVKALRGDEQLGYCACSSGGDYSRHADSQDWAFVRSLNVIDAEQGKGLGRYLIMRALSEMNVAGYRHAVISTSVDNYRAMLFYGNYGFRAVDWTQAFARNL